jgi:Fe-S oxidoreductase
MSLRQRMFSSLDLLGRIACEMPTMSNFFLESFTGRSLMSGLLGIARERPLPKFSPQRFDRWFARHQSETPATRGRVVLWDDTFARYYEPQVGIAATRVLEAAGFQVELPTGRECCGRPAFSQGHLSKARRLGRHNIELLNLDMESAPILFLEPSCYSMFAEDYRELGVPGWERVARRCVLFDRFVEDLLAREPQALQFKVRSGKVLIHSHCHVKSMMSTGFMARLARRLPGREVTLLETGCCGMAGAFGALRENYELSVKVAGPLLEAIRDVPYGTSVVASGTSCRQQIAHLAPVRARHMAELLASALESADYG